MVILIRYIFLTLAISALLTCSAGYQKEIEHAETSFYQERFSEAIPDFRELVKSSSNTDRLLYLMEAGIVFHTEEKYAKSNKVFKQAESLADTLHTSASKQGLSFVLSDRQSNFKGESFERVLIKFYIGLNYSLLGDMENAKRSFKKVEYELKNMKVLEQSYRQNLVARYLDAIISENQGKYNDARVEYRNLLSQNPQFKEGLADRYILAVKEGDPDDMAKYAEGANYVKAFDANLQPIPYRPDLAEVVVVHQAGKSAVKESRGRLFEDKVFGSVLRKTIEGMLRSRNTSLSTATVVAMFALAENPIPKYKRRDLASTKEAQISLNQTPLLQTIILNGYSATAIHSFNDNYTAIVTKNVASIATKFVAAALTAHAAKTAFTQKNKNKKGQQGAEIVGDIVGAVVGAAAGFGLSSTIKPDLRCWRLIPSNFQVRRFFIEAGTYEFELVSSGRKRRRKTLSLNLEEGKLQVVNFRSF